MSLKKYLASLILIINLSSCAQQKAENSIRLIPEGYMGPVLIIFNQENGEPKEYEGDNRIYKIPKNGILRTQFKPNYGIQKPIYYYVNSVGDRTEIPFINVQEKESLNKVNKSKIYAYREQALGEGLNVSSTSQKSKVEPARAFYIGNLLDTEKTAREQMNFVFEHHN